MTDSEKLKIAMDALEFYGAIACPLPGQLNDNEEAYIGIEMDRHYYKGGKRARQAIQEITKEVE